MTVENTSTSAQAGSAVVEQNPVAKVLRAIRSLRRPRPTLSPAELWAIHHQPYWG